ncbi:MAG: phosphoenolpyruvate carboxylase, partial [Novosphingobium sp.]
MKSAAELRTRLAELHVRTAETPLFNPVFQLSLDLSRLIEAGSLDLERVEGLVAELECDALKARATRLRELVAPVDPEANVTALRRLAERSASDFEAFRTRWERPLLHVVFTAHPTFLLASAQADAVAAAAAGDGAIDDAVCVVPGKEPAITLEFEHGEVSAAIARAAAARDELTRVLLETARERWPDRWHELVPLPLRFATWVGYDMDGRTDIGWSTSIGFRLREKADRLAGYAAQLAAIDPVHAELDGLRAAAAYSEDRAGDFAGDVSDPVRLSEVANQLSADDPAKLLSLTPLIERIEREARDAAGDRAVALKVLTAAMRADGLGIGWVHFRVNASQLHNAVRRRIDPDGALDLGSRGALARLRTLLDEVRPLRSNFAALAIESATALRQFLA